jgi:DNA polymerase III delta prime subunit
MKNTFIQKYTSNTFEDIKQNDIILNLYSKFIKNNCLQLLIIGDTSSGKTTHINAIVNEYFSKNKITNYENHVLKINSLNEYGIQHSRARLHSFCQTKSFVKKIIVIDDLDLINEQNQQIIRGNINQYSDNIHFICSCSNIKKINDTLQSRLVILYINKLQKNDYVNLYNHVIEKEQINIDKQLQDIVLKQSNYSYKNILNTLELFKLYGKKITIDNYVELCNTIPYTYFNKYIMYCKNNDISAAINYLNALTKKGFSVIDILQKFMLFIKHEETIEPLIKYEIIKIISKYICIFYTIHEEQNEIIVFTKNIINIVNI